MVPIQNYSSLDAILPYFYAIGQNCCCYLFTIGVIRKPVSDRHDNSIVASNFDNGLLKALIIETGPNGSVTSYCSDCKQKCNTQNGVIGL